MDSTRVQTVTRLKRAFDDMDADRDSMLSLGEVRRAFRQARPQHLPHTAVAQYT